MNVLLTFFNLEYPRLHRYMPQFSAINDYVDELNLVYLRGDVFASDMNGIMFHKVDSVYDVYSYVKSLDIDLIYHLTMSAKTNYYVYLLSRFLGLPVVCRLRGSGFDERRVVYKSRYKRWFENSLDSFAMRRYEMVVPISERLRNEFWRKGYSNVVDSVPNGVDVELFNYSELPKEFKVGYSGRISKEKGSEFLMALIRECSDINFVVAGDIQDKDFVVLDNVEYLGYLEYEDMSKFYDGCSMVVMPSLVEGISNTLNECYSKGRVVLMSDIVQPFEYPRFYNRLGGSVSLWSEYIRSYRDNLNIYGDVRLSAREFIEGLGWDDYGAKMYKKFEDCLRSM